MLAAGLCACGLFFPTIASDAQGTTGDGGGGGNGTVGGDATNGLDGSGDGGVAAKDFSISVSPGYLPLTASQSASVTVTAHRLGSFTGEVDLFMTPPAYVMANSMTIIPAGSTTSTFTLTAMPALPASALGDFIVQIAGKDSTASETATALLTVHLAGLLATFDTPGDGGAATFTVPSNVPLIRVKAWGAGGSSGDPNCAPGCTGGIASGAGGGGGFVLADVPVVPNETLGVIVGAAGGYGGYGGGASAVLRGIAGGGTSSTLTIAGGGGGGATWYVNCGCNGGAGGAGGGVQGQGGAVGQVPSLNACLPPAPGGGGATQTSDGVSYGGAFYVGLGGGGLHDGGAGAPPPGGACNPGEPGGGGGGSGGTDVHDAGIDVISNVTGSWAVPANTTDPDYGDAGAGMGAPACMGTGACATGNAGRIVIFVP